MVGRLVEQQQVRLGRDGDRESEPASLADREQTHRRGVPVGRQQPQLAQRRRGRPLLADQRVVRRLGAAPRVGERDVLHELGDPSCAATSTEPGRRRAAGRRARRAAWTCRTRSRPETSRCSPAVTSSRSSASRPATTRSRTCTTRPAAPLPVVRAAAAAAAAACAPGRARRSSSRRSASFLRRQGPVDRGALEPVDELVVVARAAGCGRSPRSRSGSPRAAGPAPPAARRRSPPSAAGRRARCSSYAVQPPPNRRPPRPSVPSVRPGSRSNRSVQTSSSSTRSWLASSTTPAGRGGTPSAPRSRRRRGGWSARPAAGIRDASSSAVARASRVRWPPDRVPTAGRGRARRARAARPPPRPDGRRPRRRGRPRGPAPRRTPPAPALGRRRARRRAARRRRPSARSGRQRPGEHVADGLPRRRTAAPGRASPGPPGALDRPGHPGPGGQRARRPRAAAWTCRSRSPRPGRSGGRAAATGRGRRAPGGCRTRRRGRGRRGAWRVVGADMGEPFDGSGDSPGGAAGASRRRLRSTWWPHRTSVGRTPSTYLWGRSAPEPDVGEPRRRDHRVTQRPLGDP